MSAKTQIPPPMAAELTATCVQVAQVAAQQPSFGLSACWAVSTPSCYPELVYHTCRCGEGPRRGTLVRDTRRGEDGQCALKPNECRMLCANLTLGYRWRWVLQPWEGYLWFRPPFCEGPMAILGDVSFLVPPSSIDGPLLNSL